MILAIFIFSSCPLQNMAMAMSSRMVRCTGKEGWRLQQFDGTIMKWNRGYTHRCQAQGTNRMSWCYFRAKLWLTRGLSVSAVGAPIYIVLVHKFLTFLPGSSLTEAALRLHQAPQTFGLLVWKLQWSGVEIDNISWSKLLQYHTIISGAGWGWQQSIMLWN